MSRGSYKSIIEKLDLLHLLASVLLQNGTNVFLEYRKVKWFLCNYLPYSTISKLHSITRVATGQDHSIELEYCKTFWLRKAIHVKKYMRLQREYLTNYINLLYKKYKSTQLLLSVTKSFSAQQQPVLMRIVEKQLFESL